jgi:hypothetical protein
VRLFITNLKQNSPDYIKYTCKGIIFQKYERLYTRQSEDVWKPLKVSCIPRFCIKKAIETIINMASQE